MKADVPAAAPHHQGPRVVRGGGAVPEAPRGLRGGGGKSAHPSDGSETTSVSSKSAGGLLSRLLGAK